MSKLSTLLKGFNTDKLLTSLQNKDPNLISIDITQDSIKVLRLSGTHDELTVENFASVPLPVNAIVNNDIKDIEAISKALTLALSRSGTTAKHAITAIMASSVITKLVSMDSGLSEMDMESQALLEAEHFVPYPAEEVSLDFVIEGESANNANDVDVLLVASRSEEVLTLVDVLEAADIKAHVIDVASYAIGRACTLLTDQLYNSGKDQTIAIVDIGASHTNFTVLHDFNLVYTRDDTFSNEKLLEKIQQEFGLDYQQAKAAKFLGEKPKIEDFDMQNLLYNVRETTFQNIQRLLQFFFSSSQYDQIDHLLLGGVGSIAPDIEPYIAKYLNTPATQIDLFHRIKVAPHVNTNELKEHAPSLMVVTGLAMREIME